MRNILPAVALFALPLLGQIAGVVNSFSADTFSDLRVQLIDIGSQRIIAQARVFSDGTFNLPPQAPGFAEIRFVNDAGTVLCEREIHTVTPGVLAIQLPSRKPGGAGGPISARRLGHKTPKAATKAFAAAQKAHRAKDRDRAIQDVQAAAEMDLFYFDALKNLGALYLQGLTPEAAKP